MASNLLQSQDRAVSGLYPYSVYTITRSSNLFRNKNELWTGRRWVAVQRMIADARKVGLSVPVLIGGAEDTEYLKAWALLDGLRLRPKGTQFRFSKLKHFRRGQLAKTSLVKKAGGRIPADYIRSYVICRTPPKLSSLRTAPFAEMPFVGEEFEGRQRSVRVNVRERNPRVRARCFDIHGMDCAICKLNFAKTYNVREDLLHVHHLRPMSTVRRIRQVRPSIDLIPVCPNCHAVIHSRPEPYTPAAVRRMLRRSKLG